MLSLDFTVIFDYIQCTGYVNDCDVGLLFYGEGGMIIIKVALDVKRVGSHVWGLMYL